MGKTKIEWAERVWNPVTGCTKVSPGCAHCYAERMAKRLAGRAGYPKDEPFKVTLHPDRLDQPLKWRKPSRIFVCSMGDLFHGAVPSDFINTVLDMTNRLENHNFLFLTKRPDRMLNEIELFLGKRAIREPLPHQWFGVSVENQKTADERIPILLQIPAAVRFVSAEPLLGEIDLSEYLEESGYESGGVQGWVTTDLGLDWVIVGGESGAKSRPMHPDWVRLIRNQCVEAGVPFFFKQWGGWAEILKGGYADDEYHGGQVKWVHTIETENILPGTVMMRRVGKKKAGRLLDGREWNEYPRKDGG